MVDQVEGVCLEKHIPSSALESGSQLQDDTKLLKHEKVFQQRHAKTNCTKKGAMDPMGLHILYFRGRIGLLNVLAR